MIDPPEKKETPPKTTEEQNLPVSIHQLTQEDKDKLPKDQVETIETIVEDAIYGGTSG